MSHTVEIQIKMRNLDAIKRAVEKLGGSVMGEGTHKLYGGNTAKGYGINLPGWRYPVVVKDGKAAMDKYGNSSDALPIESLEQHYGVEVSKIEMERQGVTSFNEYTTKDGDIILEAFMD
jgi:hypothetical protein